ncbi:hypothetical protein IGI04_036622 [Brassica rapa subsp. trilocularis]|uniref:Uncharacterized protein n=1 Tax=Brassica rapa subsp. trilocularis TaxID=1813537 RepID=A0ABQ7LFY9_BRACM|nr:hypothetical protein IGI04_036622 [Brassica rapa subsp. trilocularis]
MKTVRPNEFASRHSEDSIRSIASRSDDQMSFLLSTIDQIDEVKFIDTLGIYRFFLWIRIHASVGEQLIKKFDDKLRERDAIVVQLFKVYDAIGAYSISSGYNSTHILLNPTLEFIEEFKASLHDDSLALTNNDSSQWSVGTATSIRARSFFLNERLSIREIIDSTLNEDEDFLPEAVSDLFGKRVLFEISVDADNIKGKSSQCVVRLATDDREMVEEFADLPPKPVLMLESADDISSGSGGFTATPLSKRKSEQDEDSCLEDQHSVNKKLSQKKLKGE